MSASQIHGRRLGLAAARLLPLLGLVMCSIVWLDRAATAQTAASLKTRPERTEYRETSRSDEVLAFLKALPATPRLHITKMGYSFQGAVLPLVVVGNLPDARAASVLAAGKTRVLIQANTHGGEVDGKEATLVLLRELASRQHLDWDQELVLLIVPNYNPDGNDQIKLTNRSRQYGPIGGVGQGPNGQNLQLNRDYVKLETPEVRAMVRLLRDYDPHVVIDLRTTNGSAHAYHLTYAPPLNPNTDRAIIDLLRNDWFPAVTRSIKAKYGWDYYYYGTVPGPTATNPQGWYTFDYRPRFNNNYAGLRNRFAIISTSYSYASFEERILATRRFIEECLDYATQNAARIRQATADADARTVAGQRMALRAAREQAPQPVEILVSQVEEVPNPYTGLMMARRTDVRKPERMPEFGTFAGTEFERAPLSYYVPAELAGVIEKLDAHGVRISRLAQPQTLSVEQYKIASTQVAEKPFEGHAERTVTGGWEAVERTLPAGTVVVPMDQPLARLVFVLLEPRSDDGLLDWNAFDEALKKDATYYPVLRKPAPSPGT